jgi:glycosyltransferase involved in cell wall biosynthesis
MMAASSKSPARPVVDGKFFRVGRLKFHVKGLTYGPFAPNDQNELFPSRDQVARDFQQIRELGANLLRLYSPPPPWLLDLAEEHALKLLIDIPWAKQLCFLNSQKTKAEAREIVRSVVKNCRRHPAVFAYSVVNEIPAEIVRWSGVRKTTDFIEELIDVAKDADPDCLCTFASFPPTEFLHPRNPDFICFNLYLHHRKPFESYLARLQMLADDKPLLLGEMGIDSLREGEERKSEILSWHIESAFRGGLAGAILFSFTDDWFRDGRQIVDWAFGLTTRERKPKASFWKVRELFLAAPWFTLACSPKVSIVVACYNGARTLKACLDSLSHLNYPNYDVILVDDGSTDDTPEIARSYPAIRYLRQDNHGLSVARNTGIAAAAGEIVAFTDSDCRADEDWLHYLVGALVNSEFAGIGGHNFLPPDDSCVAAAVLVSPGGPAHVMLSDREAEHIPGCNMAFYKWALEEIGGFDPVFRKAGDDVDVCWRLQERGYKIGFSPAGFVWHYRRSTMQAYLKQQAGYGEAEALLARKHPEYFNFFGGGVWRGRIYSASKFAVTLQAPVIYHGTFGSGFFQKLYTPQPVSMLMLCTSLEYHVLVTLPLLVVSVPFGSLLPVALTSVLISLAVCMAAAVQAELPRNKQRFWSRPLVAWLFLLQPIVRGWARYKWRLTVQSEPPVFKRPVDRGLDWAALEDASYWSEYPVDRHSFLHKTLAKLEAEGWQHKTDTGWNDYDVEIFGSRWSRLRLTTVSEELPGGKRIIRCRLKATWSLPARIAFWSACGVELLVIGWLAAAHPWIWMLLLTMSVFGWWLEQERRTLLLWIAAFLDEVASEHGLAKLTARGEDGVKPSRISELQGVAMDNTRT